MAGATGAAGLTLVGPGLALAHNLHGSQAQVGLELGTGSAGHTLVGPGLAAVALGLSEQSLEGCCVAHCAGSAGHALVGPGAAAVALGLLEHLLHECGVALGAGAEDAALQLGWHTLANGSPDGVRDVAAIQGHWVSV